MSWFGLVDTREFILDLSDSRINHFIYVIHLEFLEPLQLLLAQQAFHPLQVLPLCFLEPLRLVQDLLLGHHQLPVVVLPQLWVALLPQPWAAFLLLGFPSSPQEFPLLAQDFPQSALDL